MEVAELECMVARQYRPQRHGVESGVWETTQTQPLNRSAHNAQDNFGSAIASPISTDSAPVIRKFLLQYLTNVYVFLRPLRFLESSCQDVEKIRAGRSHEIIRHGPYLGVDFVAPWWAGVTVLEIPHHLSGPKL